MEKKKLNPSGIIGAICFISLGIYYGFTFGFIPYNYLRCFGYVCIGFGYLLNKNIVMLIGCCIYVVKAISDFCIGEGGFLDVLWAMTPVALLFVVALYSVRASGKNIHIANSIWFLPGTIISILAAILIVPDIGEIIEDCLKYGVRFGLIWWIPYYILHAVSCFLLCFGLKVKNTENKAKNTVVSCSNFSIGDADRLKACKDLLDSGAITQEEFEEKKKQILGIK